MKAIRLLCLLIIIAIVSTAAAQDDLTETYISEDGSVRFNHAPDWGIVEDGGVVYIETALFFLALYPPDAQPNPDATSLREVVKSFTDSAGTVEFGRTTRLSLDSGGDAQRVEVTLPDQPEDSTAFLLAFEADGVFIVFLSTGDSSMTETVYALADSVEVGDFEPEPASEPAFFLDIEESSADNWEVVVEAMREADLITGDGELVFEADMTSTSMGGVLNVDEESESTYPNFAGGALLSFRPEDQDENVCGFIVRLIEGEEQFRQFLFVGVDAEDNLVVIGYDEENPTNSGSIREPSGATFHQPNFLFFTLNDNRLTVFVNGGAVIDGLPVELPEPDARGNAEPSLAGAELEYSCVMTTAWIYGFE